MNTGNIREWEKWAVRRQGQVSVHVSKDKFLQ